MGTVIEVRKEDITSGKRCKDNACPVALAILRKADPFSEVRVGRAGFHYGDRYIRFPALVTSWIERYDDGQEVAPFVFRLNEDI